MRASFEASRITVKRKYIRAVPGTVSRRTETRALINESTSCERQSRRRSIDSSLRTLPSPQPCGAPNRALNYLLYANVGGANNHCIGVTHRPDPRCAVLAMNSTGLFIYGAAARRSAPASRHVRRIDVPRLRDHVGARALVQSAPREYWCRHQDAANYKSIWRVGAHAVSMTVRRIDRRAHRRPEPVDRALLRDHGVAHRSPATLAPPRSTDDARRTRTSSALREARAPRTRPPYPGRAFLVAPDATPRALQHNKALEFLQPDRESNHVTGTVLTHSRVTRSTPSSGRGRPSARRRARALARRQHRRGAATPPAAAASSGRLLRAPPPTPAA